MADHDYTESALHMLKTAGPDETLVVSVIRSGQSMVTSVRSTRAADLVHLARSLLDQAADTLDETAESRDEVDLLHRVRAAMAELPDPDADDEGDDTPVTAPAA